MSGSTKIAQLLAGTYRDPESGEAVGVQTRSLAMEPTLDGAERELVEGLGFGRRLAVVSDTKPSQVTSWTWVCGAPTGGATGCGMTCAGSSSRTR